MELFNNFITVKQRAMKQALIKIVLCCIVALSFCGTSLGQSFDWAKGGGTTTSVSIGTPFEKVFSMTTDPNGNVYALSRVYNGTIIADTFSGRGASSRAPSLLITSYDCSGQMRWAKLITSSGGQCDPFGIIADSLGHIYVAGFFINRTCFIGNDTSISGLVYQNMALVQLDTLGHFNWIRYLGDNTIATLNASLATASYLAIDSSNNIHFIVNIKFGMPLTSTLTTHMGMYDVTYNASGTLTDARRIQLDSSLVMTGAVIDRSSGKLYAIGHTAGIFTSGTTLHNFVAAFDTGRNLIWKDTLSYPAGFLAAFGGLTTDERGYLYVTTGGVGYTAYRGDTTFNTLTGSGDIACVMKIDTGSNLVWSRGYSATGTNANLLSITTVPGNKVAAAGTMGNILTADHETVTPYSGEGSNAYFTVLDTAGSVTTIQQIHGNDASDQGSVIVSNRVGNLYLGGQAGDSVWVDSAGYRSVGGNTDFFVMKYGVDCGCTSMPIAWYDTTRTGAGGATVAFTFTGTTSGIDSMRWYFGDGSTGTSTSPTHTYSAIDTYYACVYIYSSCGNDHHCIDIGLPCLSAPTAAFSRTGSTAARSFTYTGTTAGIDSLVWSFGDGSLATGNSVSHTYTATGSYMVCVTAYNHCGSDVSCFTISVPCLSRPTASYSTTGTITTRNFTYTGTTVSLDSVVWKFGDGTRATGTTATHTYSAIGIFTACVYAYNPCGMDSSCTTISVPCLTTPSASYTHTGIPTTSFTYTGATAGIDSIVWHFGDGSRGLGTSTTHTYTAIDTVTACVIAYSRCGNDSSCTTIYIPCLAMPVAGASTSGSGHSWTFTYTGTTPSLDSLTWRFGDGTSGYGGTVSYSFTLAGTYNVCATAYNHCGWDSACVTVVVPCDTIAASFTDTGVIHKGFHYTGTTAYVDSIVWLYGDGNRDTGRNATHAFTSSGIYHVCVIAYSSCTSDSACRDISVIGLGVNDIPMNDIQVFPNPARDEINVSGIQSAMQYRLLDVTGVSLRMGELTKPSNIVAMNGLSSGIYMLELSGQDKRKLLFRIIKL
ncbi:MAG: PKD domain-containing protein [Chitinophagia bacterium]|nr:PKD domain-containing protein [Chitinophagia bacterium]